MNKNVVKITALVAGILTAVVALFFAITGIIALTNFNGNADARWNAWIAVSAILDFAVAAGLGVISYFVIKEYVKKEENKKHWFLCATATYFTFVVVFILVVMIVFNTWDSAMNWVKIVFGAAGLVLAIVALMGKAAGVSGKVLACVSIVIGFILVILGLVNNGGLDLAVGIFAMFMFIAFFLYYLFDMIVDGVFTTSTNTEKAEAKEEAKVEETAEAKEVETKEE